MDLKIVALCSASAATMLLAASPCFAQASSDNPAAAKKTGSGEVSEVVVTGLRQSLTNAEAIKKNAPQVVDSIVAEDIGKLPDNTVSDALQRVTGVQVTRAGQEVGTVLIRGLPNIETVVNGREIFTGTGRGVALADIPAELVAGVDVYKTNTPDQIEGSVSGIVDIRLHRPLDFPGREIAGGVRGIYSDQADKWSYIGSGLYSNHWTLPNGQDFGVLVGASYNKRQYEDQTAFNFGFNPFSGPATNGATVLIPDTVGGLVTDGDRKRTGVNASVQWKPTPDLELHADALYTGYREDQDVSFFVGLPKAGNVVSVTPQAGSAGPQTNNTLVAGTITTLNNFTISSKQTFHNETDGYQYNFGGRWDHGPLTLTSDLTYDKSKVSSIQYVLDTDYVVPQINYNFNSGGTPHINFNGFDYRNTGILNLFQLFDNHNIADSDQTAWRGDATYKFDSSSPITDIQAGVRWADRNGSSAGTNTGSLLFPGGTVTPAAVGSNAPDDIVSGLLGVNGFAVPSTAFIRDNIAALRAQVGFPVGGQPFDPNQSFSLEEKVSAAYAQAGFNFDAFGVPIDGIAGARFVKTQTDLHAIQLTSSGGVTTPTPINSNRDEDTVLPSVTLRAHPMDNVVLRLVVGKTFLRPQFAQLDPALSLTVTGATGNSSTFGTGSGGNPQLGDVKSTNFDGTAEWYFSNTGLVTLSAFYKKLNGYIQTYSAVETQPFNGTPQTFLISRPRNTGDGSLKGLEAAYTQFFDFLPEPLNGLGVQANVTLSEGEVQGPPDATGVSPGLQPITGVSHYSYNLVAMYEKHGLSARLAYNWRSRWTDSYSPSNPGGSIIVEPIGFLDFSASYNLTDDLTVTVDATNLTDTRYRDNFGSNGFTPRDTREYDRTFGAGLRFRF
ncbi:MAG: TonB-dependent receptor [Phenylobacterium sp.]|nr:MAG: TonB-dependent receptor [Phenylobacterium sp.]